MNILKHKLSFHISPGLVSKRRISESKIQTFLKLLLKIVQLPSRKAVPNVLYLLAWFHSGSVSWDSRVGWGYWVIQSAYDSWWCPPCTSLLQRARGGLEQLRNAFHPVSHESLIQRLCSQGSSAYRPSHVFGYQGVVCGCVGVVLFLFFHS